MVGQFQTHETSTSLVQPDLGKLDADTDIVLQVKVSCSSACDLRGKPVRIIDQDAAVLKEVELTASDETANQTDEFVVKSPIEPGEYTWTAVFPAQETDGDLHQQSSTQFSFIVKPHVTSMAVWDVESPLIVDTDFKLKVGVKCSVGCNLARENIEFYDHEGVKVATATLGDVPYSDRVELYWTEVVLRSPATPGVYRWEARLPKPGLEPAHAGASFHFGFSVAKQPEYAVSIEVVDQVTNAPVANARVMLRPYSSHTDDKGVAMLETAGGEYTLYVTTAEYETFQATVTVAGDATIQALLTPALFKEDYRGNLWKVERKKLLPGGYPGRNRAAT